MSKSDSELIEEKVDFGSILAAARQTKNYSVDDVCEYLKIPRQVIAAIESNNIEALPPVIFTQGYIRAYAKFLEIPEENVLAIYSRAMPHEAAANLRLRSSLHTGTSSQSPLFKAMTLLLIVSAIAALVFAGVQYYQGKVDDMETRLESREESFTGHSLDSPGNRPLDIQQNARLTGDDKLVVGSTGPVDDSAVASLADGSESSSMPGLQAEAKPAEEAQASAGNDVLEIFAKKGSWLQVRDATNKRLFNNMVPVGATQKLEGEAPFRISLGNARSTSVFINDLEIDMTELITRKNIATFTVSAKEETVFFH